LAPSEKQRRFFAEYAVDQNGTQAAIRAGYSPKSAYVTASRLLKRAKDEPVLAAEKAKVRANVLRIVAKSSPEVIQAENTAAYAVTKTLELIEYGTSMTPVLGMFGPIIDPVTGEPIMEMKDPRTATANLATLVRQFSQFSEKHDVNVQLRAQVLGLVAEMSESELRDAKARLT